MATQRSGEQQQEEEKEKKCEMRLVYHLSRCQSGLETAGRVFVASEEFQMATQPWAERGIQWREREKRQVSPHQKGTTASQCSVSTTILSWSKERERGCGSVRWLRSHLLLQLQLHVVQQQWSTVFLIVLQLVGIL